MKDKKENDLEDMREEIKEELKEELKDELLDDMNGDDNNKKNKNKSILIILIILILILISILVFNIYNNKNNSNNNQNNSNNNQNQNTELDNSNSNDDIVDNNNNNKNNNNNNKVKKMNARNFAIKLENEITDKDNSEVLYKIIDYNEFKGITLHQNYGSASNVVNMKVDANHFRNLGFPVAKNKENDVTLKFDRNVQLFIIGGIGQDIAGTYALFLMDDGTVRYLNVLDFIASESFDIKTVPVVKNVVKLLQVTFNTKYVGAVSVLAQQNDGKFYDLSNYINGTGKAIESEIQYQNLSLNEKNIGSSNVKYLLNYFYGLHGVKAELNLNSNKIILSFDKKNLVSPHANLANEVTLTFDKKVIDFAIVGFGHGYGDESLYAILEDGTVAYVHLVKGITENNFTIKNVPNLKNIFRLLPVDRVNTNAAVGAGVTCLAQDTNGKYFDLLEYR